MCLCARVCRSLQQLSTLAWSLGSLGLDPGPAWLDNLCLTSAAQLEASSSAGCQAPHKSNGNHNGGGGTAGQAGANAAASAPARDDREAGADREPAAGLLAQHFSDSLDSLACCDSSSAADGVAPPDARLGRPAGWPGSSDAQTEVARLHPSLGDPPPDSRLARPQLMRFTSGPPKEHGGAGAIDSAPAPAARQVSDAGADDSSTSGCGTGGVDAAAPSPSSLPLPTIIAPGARAGPASSALVHSQATIRGGSEGAACNTPPPGSHPPASSTDCGSLLGDSAALSSTSSLGSPGGRAERHAGYEPFHLVRCMAWVLCFLVFDEGRWATGPATGCVRIRVGGKWLESLSLTLTHSLTHSLSNCMFLGQLECRCCCSLLRASAGHGGCQHMHGSVHCGCFNFYVYAFL